jgi:hypothetical protein
MGAGGGGVAKMANTRYWAVERPDPKDLSTFSQCTEFPLHWGFESRPPDLELAGRLLYSTPSITALVQLMGLV